MDNNCEKKERFNGAHFRSNMPDWKRKKDPILSRLFYRQVSFYLAAFCANMGWQANSVSYFSMLVGVLACLLFFFGKSYAIIGAVLINIWLILDCTDGNLARTVKKQPFGEFADGISSYVLVGLMCTAFGVYVYMHGGILIDSDCPWMILIGALGSSSDSLMRLIYQKYKNTEKELAEAGILEMEKEVRTDQEKVGSLRVRIEAELGIGGILPLAILLAVVFDALDLVVLYCFAYYGMSFLGATSLYVRKAIIRTKECEGKESSNG